MRKMFEGFLDAMWRDDDLLRTTGGVAMNTKILVFGDVHIPFQDEDAVNLIFKFIKKVQPDVIVINGDLIDFFAISKWDKGLGEGKTVKEELEETRSFLEKLVAVSKASPIYYIFGNHEIRLEKYLIRNAKEISDLVKLEELLRLKELGIIPICTNRVENYVKIGNWYIGHFNRVSKHSAYTVKNIIADRGVNVIQAHVHRLGMHYVTFMDRTVCGIEGGCLCDINPKYVVNPNWQQGIVVIENYGHYSKSSVQLIELKDEGKKKVLYFHGDRFST